MACEHSWFVVGIITKPHVKAHYHNNFVFCCEQCSIIHMSVNNRTYPVMIFDTLEDLGQFCLRSQYIGNMWPKAEG